MKITDNKPYKITLRLTEKQYKYCENVSKKASISIADLIRIYIDTICYNVGADYENDKNVE